MRHDVWSAQFAETAGDVPVTEMTQVEVSRAGDVGTLLQVMLDAHPEMYEKIKEGAVYLSCTAPGYALMRRTQ